MKNKFSKEHDSSTYRFYYNKDKLSISCKLQLFGIYIYPISPPTHIYISLVAIAAKNIRICTMKEHTVCPRSSVPFYVVNLLYKMGHYFLDIKYINRPQMATANFLGGGRYMNNEKEGIHVRTPYRDTLLLIFFFTFNRNLRQVGKTNAEAFKP